MHLRTNTDSWLNKYEHFLTNVAGLRESSCIVYRRNARYLLVALFPDDRVDWTIVDAEILRNFVCQQAQEVGKAIADYIQHTRARSATTTVFLKACPPFAPFASAAAIGCITKRATHRRGVAVHAGMAAHTALHQALGFGIQEEKLLLPASVMHKAEQFVGVPPLTGQPRVARRHGIPTLQPGG